MACLRLDQLNGGQHPVDNLVVVKVDRRAGTWLHTSEEPGGLDPQSDQLVVASVPGPGPYGVFVSPPVVLALGPPARPFGALAVGIMMIAVMSPSRRSVDTGDAVAPR
ncbi:hypothetical protein GCE86_09495 [Micromonospora terminaliae]|uniref:Uncharacterized protein n=1 Tax=Micromonospora terminaliae TaxID=1914461 RepID=A0AAJ2ZE04_9ACTN|nr:hypothetical protein [Micromonospora terminaliae]NES27990.1 hypothetical protein [Micromonospora terminaliae]QGL47248.1 hypothetical protein GCE86_09495 [Micromonospora terminaliae]